MEALEAALVAAPAALIGLAMLAALAILAISGILVIPVILILAILAILAISGILDVAVAPRVCGGKFSACVRTQSKPGLNGLCIELLPRDRVDDIDDCAQSREPSLLVFRRGCQGFVYRAWG